MTKDNKRQEILASFRSRIDAHQAILGFGAGCGMTAGSAMKGGADFISIYSAAMSRIDGVPSFLAWLPYGDCNEQMRNVAPKILPLIKGVPAIAGLGAHDPRIDIDALVDEFAKMGFIGVSNEPFCSTYGKEFAQMLNKAGIGFNRELELLKCARDKNLITLGWAADMDDVKALVDIGVDIIGLLAGGEKLDGEDEEQFVSRILGIIKEENDYIKRENPDIITLIHGGPINNVEMSQRGIRATGVDGVATGSGGERIPSEKVIKSVCEEYKAIKVF